MGVRPDRGRSVSLTMGSRVMTAVAAGGFSDGLLYDVAGRLVVRTRNGGSMPKQSAAADRAGS